MYREECKLARDPNSPRQYVRSGVDLLFNKEVARNAVMEGTEVI